jgi:hypothetical protein
MHLGCSRHMRRSATRPNPDPRLTLCAPGWQAAPDGTKTAVDLSFCQLQDDDMEGVVLVLAACGGVETLDLQYNELQVGRARWPQRWESGELSRDSGLARRDRKWSLNDGQSPNFRGVRVHVSTGYNRAEGNRRASRNGRV